MPHQFLKFPLWSIINKLKEIYFLYFSLICYQEFPVQFYALKVCTHSLTVKIPIINYNPDIDNCNYILRKELLRPGFREPDFFMA